MLYKLIWIIYDDAIYSFTIKRLLEKHNFACTIEIFVNGQLALDQLKHIVSTDGDYPDVILLDINMPLVDGWQFLSEYEQLQHKPSSLIHMVSSSLDPRDHKRASNYQDLNSFVLKPMNLNNLKNILKIEA